MTSVIKIIGIERTKRRSPPVKNCLKDSPINEKLKPSNCPSVPNSKVSPQETKVNIVIHMNKRRILLIIKLIRGTGRSEEHTSELQSRGHLVCRLLLEKKK